VESWGYRGPSHVAFRSSPPNVSGPTEAGGDLSRSCCSAGATPVTPGPRGLPDSTSAVFRAGPGGCSAMPGGPGKDDRTPPPPRRRRSGARLTEWLQAGLPRRWSQRPARVVGAWRHRQADPLPPVSVPRCRPAGPRQGAAFITRLIMVGASEGRARARGVTALVMGSRPDRAHLEVQATPGSRPARATEAFRRSVRRLW
jgi:hypothetical protein